MIGLFDRDVFIRLGCCNLWSEALLVLDITQPYRLASTTSMQSNRRILSRMLPEHELAPIERRLDEMISAVPVIAASLVDEVEKTDWLPRLQGVDDIDAGEQLLLAILLAASSTPILVSGDKRFVTASIEHLPDETEKLQGSLISFERCLARIEERYGFDFVLARAQPVRRCDGTLKLALGEEASATSFRAALSSYDPLRRVDPSPIFSRAALGS